MSDPNHQLRIDVNHAYLVHISLIYEIQNVNQDNLNFIASFSHLITRSSIYKSKEAILFYFHSRAA